MFFCRQTIPLTFAIQALLCAGRLAEAVTPKLDVAIGGNDGGGWRVERREQGGQMFFIKNKPTHLRSAESYRSNLLHTQAHLI